MIVPFLMLTGLAASPIDLACTTAPRGNVVRYRFSIEADAKSFTGRLMTGGQEYPISGVAAVSDDNVLLTQRDEKITTLYRISRVTGDLQMEMGLNEQSPIERVAGSCHKFTGNAF